MKSADIIIQLMADLPLYTNLFNDEFGIASITSVGTTATCTTSVPHTLSNNDIVTITGSTAPILIESFTRSDTVGTIVTSTNHDFTFSDAEKARGLTQNVITTGANESEFNGTFALNADIGTISVPNRRTLIVDMDDAGATTATGTPILQNGSAYGYNGTFNAVVLDTTTFEYALDEALPLPAQGTPILSAKFRITGAITAERFYQDSYTAQEPLKLWACVVIDDTVASKQREVVSDATAKYGGKSTYFRQELTQSVSIHVAQSTGASLSGRAARDLIEDEVTPAILKSILTVNFPTYFQSDDNKRLVFNSHSISAYNVGYYIHQYNFEQEVEIIDQDVAPSDFNVALRDIFVTYVTQLGTQDKTLAIDTDQEIL